MANIKKKRTSVITIILWDIFFFPVGIYFIHRRLTEDKTETLRNSRTVNVLGWILVVLGLIYLLLGFTGGLKSENGESVVGMIVIMVALFLGGGLLTLRGAKRMRILGERYNKYCQIIYANQTDLVTIANAAGVSAETAQKDLRDMIDSGFFPGAYIDLTLQEVILPGSRNKNQQVNMQQPAQQTIQNEPRRKVVKCPNCGASNEVVEGITKECEYCETPIAFEE